MREYSNLWNGFPFLKMIPIFRLDAPVRFLIELDSNIVHGTDTKVVIPGDRPTPKACPRLGSNLEGLSNTINRHSICQCFLLREPSMSSNLPRGLRALELLARHPGGLPLHAIANELQVPRSTAHRILAELVGAGYVQQADGDFSPYRLTLKVATLGMQFLSATGLVQLVQPVLDRLAAASGELARMSIVEDDRLIWVAKAQGAKGGLRYDAQSDPGEDVRLFCSSNGQAWLSTLSDQKALEIVSRQGFGDPGQFGPNAPRTIEEFLESIRSARERGYAVAHETYEVGLTAIAAPVRHPQSEAAIGAVSIAGPAARMTDAESLVPLILDAAHELSVLGPSIRACVG